MPRNKYQIVLRRNPTGKTETAENGQKIRTMGPYNKKSDAVKDAKALPVQTGIAVLVEPVPAAKNFRSASKLVGSLSRRMAKKPKRRKTTGPSRGIKGGYVSNPRGAMDGRRQAHQMAADIADAAHKAMMKVPYRRLHLGFVPSRYDGKRITKAGTIYIQDENAKTPAGYQYIMPIPRNLERYQLVNRLREITGKLPVLGERGGKPKIVVQVAGLKKNPRSRAGIISNPRATLTPGQTITITGETARGTTKSLTLTVWRVYADGRALCKSASGTLYLWNPVPGILTTTAGKRRRVIIHGVASFARKNPRSRAGIISNPRKLWKRVGDVRIYRDSEWDEYIVKDPEGGTYHTDDKEDALATARRMNTARKNPRRRVTIEAEKFGGHTVYLHESRRIRALTPPVPLSQAKEIANIVRSYPKNYTAEQIGSELHQSFFARKNPRRHKGPSTHVHRRKRSHGGPGITSNPRKSNPDISIKFPADKDGWKRVVYTSPAGYKDVIHEQGPWQISRVSHRKAQPLYGLYSHHGGQFVDHGRFSTVKAAKQAAEAHIVSNPRVSFQTKDGPVSFMAKSNPRRSYKVNALVFDWLDNRFPKWDAKTVRHWNAVYALFSRTSTDGGAIAHHYADYRAGHQTRSKALGRLNKENVKLFFDPKELRKVKNNPRSRSGYMTKAQFISFFRSEVWPSIKHRDPTARRTTWNDMIDSFEKDGTIDPRADWTQPDWVGAHRRRRRR